MANFTSEDIRLAQESEKKYGVPASVTLAQYALESGYGTSTLARTRNNYFGMRNGSAGWQTFDSKADSFDAHGKLLSNKLYSSKTAGAQTVEEYVRGFAETYAPSSDGNVGYADKVLKIIEENNLTQYDGGSLVGITTTKTTGKSSIANSVLSAVVQGVSVVAVAILAVVLFMVAFDLKIPSVKGGVI